MNIFNQEILFSREECELILSEHSNFTRSIAADVSRITSESVKKQLQDTRTSFDSKIDLTPETEKLLLSKLNKYGISSVDAVSIVVRYEKGQYFTKHRDSEQGMNHRYKTLVIQLSDGKDYEGGDLVVHDKEGNKLTANKNIGNAIIFNSDLLHEAKPIISGTRYIWITWLRSTDFNLKKGII